MNRYRLIVGDVRERLRELPAASVQCVVTSPPYWGLRDYGTAKWEGGDTGCDHVQSRKPPTVESSSTLGYSAVGGHRRIADGNTYHEAYTTHFRDLCGKCGARCVDAQLGLERTPEEYVTNMVAVFREVRRVLREDGTLWLNLGDSYAASGMGGNPEESDFRKQATNAGSLIPGRRAPPGLKPKDLVGIPWRVAFALQADGWWLRLDIVWSKPNPMPESVTDRPTKAHEYVFLLTKSERYFYDADAVREDAAPESAARYEYEFSGAPDGATIVPGDEQGQRTRPDGFRDFNGKRNRRSVWTIATQPYSGAHFATCPEALVEPCILAGSRVGDVVLDPFFGSGTVGVVALKRGREAWGIELNPKYAQLARERIEGDAPLLNRAYP